MLYLFSSLSDRHIESPIQPVNPPSVNINTTSANQQTTTQTAVSTTKQANELAVPSESELYELKVNLIQPKGFSIQIGSYKELVNMLRIANDLKSSLKKEVRVQVANVNGDKIYRLFVGNFSTRKDAEAFKVKAVKIYPDCFIVELK